MFATIVIFILILFLYVHVQKEYKYFTDLQLYEVDYTNKKQFLEEIQTKLPIITRLSLPCIDHEQLQDYIQDDLYVKDIKEMYQTQEIQNIPLNYSRASILLETDKHASYFSSNNHHVLHLFDNITSAWDNHLKSNASFASYDVLFGSKHAVTPYKYHTNTSMYLCIPPRNKEVRIRLMPFSQNHILNVVHDYELLEFWGAKLPNNVSHSKNSLDTFLYSGQLLYIPPYWFYSIEFLDSKTIVNQIKYSSYINYLSNLKYNMKHLTETFDYESMRAFTTQYFQTPKEQHTDIETTTENEHNKGTIDISGNTSDTHASTTFETTSKNLLAMLKTTE